MSPLSPTQLLSENSPSSPFSGNCFFSFQAISKTRQDIFVVFLWNKTDESFHLPYQLVNTQTHIDIQKRQTNHTYTNIYPNKHPPLPHTHGGCMCFPSVDVGCSHSSLHKPAPQPSGPGAACARWLTGN